MVKWSHLPVTMEISKTGMAVHPHAKLKLTIVAGIALEAPPTANMLAHSLFL